MTIATDAVDLTNCDREPIHLPGLIQPHGVMLVLQDPTLEILQVSQNTAALLERAPADLLGQPLTTLLAANQITQIQTCLTADFDSINPLHLVLPVGAEQRAFDGIVHRHDGVIILELEPKSTADTRDFFDFYRQVRGTVIRLQKAATLLAMCQVGAREIQRLTGFDRVMVYRFEEDGAGRVIAEQTELDTPYLDLHYPATDIPQQARQLYLLNWLRLIPTADYQPVPLIPAHNPITQQPLDMSLSVLRSVSPIHLEYLHNMGVTASMSISLVRDRQLWGLIACHHATPRYIPYSVRTLCEFIGQVMSVELANKETRENFDAKIQSKSLQTQFVETLSQAHSLLEGMVQLRAELLQLVDATGAVICSGDRCISVGQTPNPEAVQNLLQWIKPQLQQSLFATRCLPKDYPAGAAFQAIASGVLVLEISQTHHSYILWFRPEVIETVNWGGNPNKPVEVLENGEVRLTPRQSFELWQETVQGCARPWQPYELEAVAELRNLIAGIVLRQADELAAINDELQRSNDELDSFAYIASHDLKEPLRGIHNYANFLMEDYGHALAEDGTAKLQTLVRLTQRMEDLINSLLHFSRLGRAELIRQPVDLHELVQQVIATLTIARSLETVEFRIPKPLPIVECDRTQVNDLFTNLITNAIKYNDKSPKSVEIGYFSTMPHHAPTPSVPIFYVRDNGLGIAQEHLDKIFQIFRRLHGRDEFGGGTGAGLTIARKIVERHHGRIWVESTPGVGSTFYFTLSAEAP